MCFCHLVNHLNLKINTWHFSRTRRLIFPIQPVGNVKQECELFDQRGGRRFPNCFQCKDTSRLTALKRSTVFGGKEPWINTVSNELWACRCSPYSQSQTQPATAAGVEPETWRLSLSLLIPKDLCVQPTLRLSGRVIDLQVKGLCVGALYYGDVVSCPFVGFGQSVGPPVSPVDLSSIHGDSKGMGQILMTPQDFNQPRAIVHSGVDSIWSGGGSRQSCMV